MAAELSERHAMWLEEQRQIPCELAARMGVVSKGDEIAFPYYRNGALSHHKLRKVGVKSFRTEPAGAEKLFWNEAAISNPQPDASLIIVEGEIDALSFLAIGEEFVVSVPNGAPSKAGEGAIDPLGDKAFSYLWDGAVRKPGLDAFKRIILATDGDEPGRILLDELAVRLGENRCWFVTWPPGTKDANDVLIRYGPDALRQVLASAKPMEPDKLVRFSEIAPEIAGAGYSSGWDELDKHLIIYPSTLAVITGKPGDGKSQFSLALCANLARLYGLRGGIIQLEDNPHRNRRDLLTYAQAWLGAPGQIGRIACDPEEWVDRMFVVTRPTNNALEDYDLKWLHSAIEQAVLRHDAKWVLLDPWNELEHVFSVNETETAYTVKALKFLKTLARKFRITIFVVTHPTKSGQAKKLSDMTLSDVSGSYAWRAKADYGIILYRGDPESTYTFVKIDKTKDHVLYGRPGTVLMDYILPHATYRFVRYGGPE